MLTSIQIQMVGESVGFKEKLKPYTLRPEHEPLLFNALKTNIRMWSKIDQYVCTHDNHTATMRFSINYKASTFLVYVVLTFALTSGNAKYTVAMQQIQDEGCCGTCKTVNVIDVDIPI